MKRLARVLTFVPALFVLGCADDGLRPPRGDLSISGQVKVVGVLLESGGGWYAFRTVRDADSIVVYLLVENTIVDSTRTIGGAYAFDNLEPGYYRTATGHKGWINDRSEPLLVHEEPNVVSDTLVLNRTGRIISRPNPVDPWRQSSRLGFELLSDRSVSISLVSPGLGTERFLVRNREYPRGSHGDTWGFIGGLKPERTAIRLLVLVERDEMERVRNVSYRILFLEPMEKPTCSPDP